MDTLLVEVVTVLKILQASLLNPLDLPHQSLHQTQLLHHFHNPVLAKLLIALAAPLQVLDDQVMDLWLLEVGGHVFFDAAAHRFLIYKV